MEEADLLIKELRIDNETLLSVDYNPLFQVFKNKKSNINYRNTYHRVEKVMEEIINLTYKGFSDSVLSYMEIYNLNSRNVDLLGETVKTLNVTKNTTFNTEDIRNIYNTTKYLKVKFHLTDTLKDVKDTLFMYSNTQSLIKKANLLIRAKNLIKDNDLQLVEGIDILRNDLLIEIDHFMIRVYDKILEYIYKDEIVYKELLRIIKVMDKYDSFDKYLLDSINNRVYINQLDNHLDNHLDNQLYIKDRLVKCNEYFNKELSLYRKLTKKQDKVPVEDDNTVLLLEDSAFLKVDYSTETLVFYKHIKNINGLYNRIRDIYEKRDINYYLINTLILINKEYKSEKIQKLIERYLNIKQSDIEEEVLYLFDIFCREGSYNNNYYINKIVHNINKNLNIIEIRPEIISGIIRKINKYLKGRNVEGAFRNKVLLLDEIFGEYTDEIIKV